MQTITRKVYVTMLGRANRPAHNSAWLILCVFGLCNAGKAQQQAEIDPGIAPRTTADQGTLPRTSMAARPDPMDAQQQLPPALETILQTWEKRSGEVKRSKGTFNRYLYDKVMETCQCATGKYYYESPDKGRMDFTPDNSVVADPPKTIERANTIYKLEPDLAKTWICDGTQILDIDFLSKTYNRVEIPAQFQGKNIGDGPLPFLFGMTAKKLKERYRLSLGPMHDPQKIIHIIAIPLHPAEQREYRLAEVLLDPQEYLPKGVQLLDPSGNRMTVYVFSSHEKPWGVFIPSPFNPPMFGLQELHNAQSNGPSPEQSAQKPGGVFFK